MWFYYIVRCILIVRFVDYVRFSNCLKFWNNFSDLVLVYFGWVWFRFVSFEKYWIGVYLLG